MIQDADRPIGTHVFTGMERSDDARDMRWTVVSMPSGHPDGGGEPSSRARGYRDRDAGPTQRGQSDPRPEGSKRGHRGSRKGSGRALVVHLPGMMAGGAADPGGVRDCGFFLLVLDPGLLTSAADPARIGVCGDAAHNPANRSCQASPRSFRTTATERERRSAIGTIDVADRVPKPSPSWQVGSFATRVCSLRWYQSPRQLVEIPAGNHTHIKCLAGDSRACSAGLFSVGGSLFFPQPQTR